MLSRVGLFAMAVTIVLCVEASGAAQEPRYGGVLNVMQREELPAGFAIHESTTLSTSWPSMPCFSNLVIFDPSPFAGT